MGAGHSDQVSEKWLNLDLQHMNSTVWELGNLVDRYKEKTRTLTSTIPQQAEVVTMAVTSDKSLSESLLSTGSMVLLSTEVSLSSLQTISAGSTTMNPESDLNCTLATEEP